MGQRGRHFVGCFRQGNLPWSELNCHTVLGAKLIQGPGGGHKLPLGSIRVRKITSGRFIRAIALVKIGEPNKWKRRAVLRWEESFGEVPKGMLVHHIDRGTLNDSPSNLFVLSRKGGERTGIWDKVNDVVEEYNKGSSCYDLAEKYQTSPSTINKLVLKHGKVRDSKAAIRLSCKSGKRFKNVRNRKPRNKLVVDAYLKGVEIGEIQKKFNLTKNVVFNILRSNKVKFNRRPRKKPLTEKEKTEILFLYLQRKKSLCYLVKRFCRGWRLIRKIIVASGGEIREVKGENHPKWQGGWFIKDGYKLIKMPDHPHANHASPKGYISEHTFIAGKKIGRLLMESEVAHHIDGNGLNNSPNNLRVMTKRDHAKSHRIERLGGGQAFLPFNRYKQVWVNRLQENGKLGKKNENVARHLWLAETILGRRLKYRRSGGSGRAIEVVHHLNGLKFDDRLENLTIMKKIDHDRYAGKGENQYPKDMETLAELKQRLQGENKKTNLNAKSRVRSKARKIERKKLLQRDAGPIRSAIIKILAKTKEPIRTIGVTKRIRLEYPNIARRYSQLYLNVSQQLNVVGEKVRRGAWLAREA